MASGYKVRLADGSEIGPLSLDELKDWLARGLIGRDSPVMRPQGSRWVPLRDVLGLKASAARATPGGAGPSPELLAAVRALSPDPRRSGAQRGSAPPAGPAGEPTERWRVLLAAALLLVGAAGATVLLVKPGLWLPALDQTPWPALALGQLALGLLLLKAWELTRKVVRVALGAAALALFPAAGILVAQRAPREALGVVGCACLLLLGLVLLLARGRLPVWHTALYLLVALGGAFGVVRLGVVTERADAAQVRAAARPDRALSDTEHGASLALPPGWVALQPTQALVPAPPGSWAVLAEPRRGGRAVVTLETLAAPASPDALLERAFAARQLGQRTELERGDVTLGALQGRRVRSGYTQGGQPMLDVTVAAHDGDLSWTFSAWMPDDGSSRVARELDSLTAALSIEGLASARHGALLTSLTGELPFLDRTAAELVLAGTPRAQRTPARTLRRGLDLAARGRAKLGADEARELDELTAVALGRLEKAARRRLDSYLSQAGQTGPAEPGADLAAQPLLKRAWLSLSDAQLARLQVLYEKAIRSGREAAPRPD